MFEKPEILYDILNEYRKDRERQAARLKLVAEVRDTQKRKRLKLVILISQLLISLK